MKISELGEFALIKLIHDITSRFRDPGQASWQQLLLGIGDDVAAWQGNNYITLATTDSLVQDVHFDLDIIRWEELGWKALAVNLSDIAAMGGIPSYALVNLVSPGQIETEGISRLYGSMTSLATEFGVAIVGGNLATGPILVITITVLGYSKDRTLLLRSAAAPGEQIAVTGYLGLSAAGQEMIKKKLSLDIETARILRRAHFKPVPRVKEGQILVEHGVNSAIDISDGLVADLTHLCEASKVSARVELEQLPIHTLSKANFPNYLDLALYGGEDYELLFTASKATIDQVRKALSCPITVIGDITKEDISDRVTLLDSKGNPIPYDRSGWEHFRNEDP